LTTAALAAALLAPFPAGAQNPASPSATPVSEVMDYLARDGGTWIAENPTHKKDDGSPPHYGYAFEWGLDRWIVRNRILGVYPERQVTYWESFSAWDPIEKRVTLYQVGRGGAHAIGHTVRHDDVRSETFLSFVMADGETFEFHEVETIRGPDEFESVSYRKVGGTWVERQRLVWKRTK